MSQHIATLIRKALILCVGAVVVLLGIILLPLPGPGLLIILAGLFILALEFDWAHSYMEAAKSKIKDMRR